MESTARVLIFTPTWIDPLTQEEAIHPDCAAAVKAQVGVEFDWHVTADNPFPVYDEHHERVYHYENVLHQYQQARAYFLNGTWDTFITVEHDNVLPDPGAVQRLVETPGDVVYAPYMLRHGQRILSTWRYENDRNLGMSLSNYPQELRRAREAVVHRISGAGFGCTLIRRHVLEQIEFAGATPRDQNMCPDLRFAETCLRKRFLSNGRFDVPVLHWDGDYCLHPFQSRRNPIMKYIALQTMNAVAAGRYVRLKQGEEISLTDEEAADLARLGAIEIVSVAAPAPPADVPIAPPVAEVEVPAPARRRTPRMPKG